MDAIDTSTHDESTDGRDSCTLPRRRVSSDQNIRKTNEEEDDDHHRGNCDPSWKRSRGSAHHNGPHERRSRESSPEEEEAEGTSSAKVRRLDTHYSGSTRKPLSDMREDGSERKDLYRRQRSTSPPGRGRSPSDSADGRHHRSTRHGSSYGKSGPSHRRRGSDDDESDGGVEGGDGGSQRASGSHHRESRRDTRDWRHQEDQDDRRRGSSRDWRGGNEHPPQHSSRRGAHDDQRGGVSSSHRMRRRSTSLSRDRDTELKKSSRDSQGSSGSKTVNDKLLPSIPKDVEDARRDDLTVLVVNISLKATEKDIWKFFTERAGTVRDVQLIRDQRSGKSKGIGYVEFTTAESVLKSLNLTGQCIMGQPVRVQASQAEKNRAAKAAKQQQVEMASQGPRKIFIGGLVGPLADLKDEELTAIFGVFGQIKAYDIPKDPYTNKIKGFAFIEYTEPHHAREAMSALNGNEIKEGCQIKVGFYEGSTSTEQTTNANNLALFANGLPAVTPDLDRVADDDDRLLHGGALTRLALSQKLQQRLSDQIPTTTTMGAAGSGPGQQQQQGASGGSSATIVAAVNAGHRALRLNNMFTPEEVKVEGIQIIDEVEEDVRSECSKFGRVVKVFIQREPVDGLVYVAFVSPDEASAAYSRLQGRYFGGVPISADFIADDAFPTILTS